MKFDYGDEVMCPRGQVGAVVGITKINNLKQAESFGAEVGEVLYTVELGDGSDLLVSEADLIPLTGSTALYDSSWKSTQRLSSGNKQS